MTIGVGICMTQLKDQITLVTRMQSNTCAVKGRRPYSNLSIWGCHFLGKKAGGFISDPLGGSQRITVKVGRLPGPAQPRTGQVMRCFTRFIKQI